MVLHWGKTQSLPINSTDQVKQPDGTLMHEVTSLQYLGAVMDGHGRSDSEVSRKLGTAKGDFRVLSKVWRHANVPLKQKLHYFESLIISRLLYGLSSMWMVTAQLRRIDGFYARCLRTILRIPPSYYSRVSNATVFTRAAVRPLSEQLLQKQFALLGKVARSPDHSLLRQDTFIPGTLQPQIGRYVRKRGRPRQDWTTELLKRGCSKFGAERFHTMLSDTSVGAQGKWKREIAKQFPAAVPQRS